MPDLSLMRDRLDEAADVMFKALMVVFMSVCVVVLVCIAVLAVLGTYGILHPGNDFSLGGRGGAGDIIPSAFWLL